VVGGDHGSLTKEPPLSKIDLTIRAIKRGMQYPALLKHARTYTHKDAPGLASQRFLLVNKDGSIAYDHFLSLVASHGLNTALVRKVMYFLWIYRDDRIRCFICERVAEQNGRWNISQLLNKKNAKFFEKWLQPTSAEKARSNFERFLVETKIYNPAKRTLHLELDDGWLEQAAIAAAQHERDDSIREELLADPIAFLARRGWLGILNDDDAVSSRRPSPLLLTDSLPLEDKTIEIEVSGTSASSDWDRHSPTSSGKANTTANIDLIARERANISHFSLEKMLADLAKGADLSPKYNQNIDLYFETPDGSVLVEIKSCSDNNFHSQVRKAISQLFEYRFVYKNLFGPEIAMLLLMETAPPREKKWLVDYAFSLGIILAWADVRKKTIVTTSSLPKSLSRLINKATKQK
jgi:hypothetical protein